MYPESGSTRHSPKVIVASSKLEPFDALGNQERAGQLNGVHRPP